MKYIIFDCVVSALLFVGIACSTPMTESGFLMFADIISCIVVAVCLIAVNIIFSVSKYRWTKQTPGLPTIFNARCGIPERTRQVLTQYAYLTYAAVKRYGFEKKAAELLRPWTKLANIYNVLGLISGACTMALTLAQLRYPGQGCPVFAGALMLLIDLYVYTLIREPFVALLRQPYPESFQAKPSLQLAVVTILDECIGFALIGLFAYWFHAEGFFLYIIPTNPQLPWALILNGVLVVKVILLLFVAHGINNCFEATDRFLRDNFDSMFTICPECGQSGWKSSEEICERCHGLGVVLGEETSSRPHAEASTEPSGMECGN